MEKSVSQLDLKKTSRLMLIQILICICLSGLTLYFCIKKQNELTELKLKIPLINKELKAIQEENTRLQYEIDQFESPVHLMELSRKPEFAHLKYPHLDKIIILLNPKLIESNNDKNTLNP